MFLQNKAELGSSFRAYITPCESCETPSRNDNEIPRKIAEGQNTASTENQVKYSNPTKGITIYPNPNKGTFYVGLSDKQDAVQQIVVFGIFGNQVMAENNPQNGVVDVSHVPPGIYVVKVLTNKGELYFEKIIKE